MIPDFQHLDLPQDRTVADYYRNALSRLLQTYRPRPPNRVQSLMVELGDARPGHGDR